MDNRKQKLIAVVGPTASGKTELSLKLAKQYGGEIVSADSRQVYKDMDVGTAKISPAERGGIPHHLIDVATPNKQFTVADYVRLAHAAIDDIIARGKLPIVCGGTMFYLDALLYDKAIPAVPPDKNLRRELEKKTPEALYAELKRRDPRRAADIDQGNKRRLIRALEIIRATGKPIPPSNHIEVELPCMYGSSTSIQFIAPKRTREELKERIKQRVYERWNGIVKETNMLHEKYGLAWGKLDSFGLEYRYATRFILGTLSGEEARERLVSATWRYAKHQLAWCAKRPVQWIQ